jgi:hypothetical protein
LVERIEAARHRTGSTTHVHSPAELLEVDHDRDADVVGAWPINCTRRLHRRRRDRHGDAYRDERQRTDEPADHPK